MKYIRNAGKNPAVINLGSFHSIELPPGSEIGVSYKDEITIDFPHGEVTVSFYEDCTGRDVGVKAEKKKK